ENPLDAEDLEAVEVGAEVQLGWQNPVAGAVPREERDALPAQRADHVRPGRIAERRGDLFFLALGQFGHVVQTAAADDSDRRLLCHACFNSIRTPPVLDE